ncbi:hypothetical protein QUF74_05175 [Candidatus Halobeggiatoa sp. HSG11]|nr:hypothetical protein [Candidatus Halobeggiatoa sp. HSG11]
MNQQSIYLFGIIIFGLLFNQGHVYSFLIKYIIMLMLFFIFLEAKLTGTKDIYQGSIYIFIAMLGIAFSAYYLISFINQDIAVIAFLIGMTPTATSAPVMLKLLKKNVNYAISSVVLTNCLVAISIPFFLPLITSTTTNIPIGNMLLSTLTVVIVPILFAKIVNFKKIKINPNIFFYSWLTALYLATAKASHYIFTESAATPIITITAIAIVAMLLCIINFYLGTLIGKKQYCRETSQSLGQKNTMFMIWIALTFVNPLAALGPMFYLIFQNIYNSYLLKTSPS